MSGEDERIAAEVGRRLLKPWRVGRKVGRTIYVQIGSDPSDSDPLIGMMDATYLAEEVVEAHNARPRGRA